MSVGGWDDLLLEEQKIECWFGAYTIHFLVLLDPYYVHCCLGRKASCSGYLYWQINLYAKQSTENCFIIVRIKKIGVGR